MRKRIEWTHHSPANSCVLVLEFVNKLFRSSRNKYGTEPPSSVTNESPTSARLASPKPKYPLQVTNMQRPRKYLIRFLKPGSISRILSSSLVRGGIVDRLKCSPRFSLCPWCYWSASIVLQSTSVADSPTCFWKNSSIGLRVSSDNGLFYVDQEALRGSIEAKLAVSPLYLSSIGSLSFPFLSTHHCFGVFYMIRTIRSFPTHRPCISVYISSFQRWSQFSVSIPCFRARFTA